MEDTSSNSNDSNNSTPFLESMVNNGIICDLETFNILNEGEKYRHDFLKELIDRFKIKMDLARQIEEKIFTVNSENDILNIVMEFDKSTNLKTYIPIHIPKVRKPVDFSSFGYTCVLYGLFSLGKRSLESIVRGTAMENFSSNMFINSSKLPFQRIFLDFDIKDESWNQEEDVIDDVSNILNQCNIPSKFLKTYRYKRTNHSFHLITEASFDCNTRYFLLKYINDFITVKYKGIVLPDFVDTIGLPTGRCHILPFRYLFNFELFKLASIIDVWSMGNQYTLLCDNPINEGDKLMQQTDDFSFYVGTQKFSFSPKISNGKSFFSKFEFYEENTVISSKLTSFKTFKELTKSIFPINKIDLQNLVKRENVGILNEHTDEHISELYQFAYVAKIKYDNITLHEIFKPNEDHNIDKMKISDINLKSFSTEDKAVFVTEEDFFTKKFDVFWTEKMEKTKLMIASTIIKQEDVWENVVPKLFKNLDLSVKEVGEYVYLICLFYKRYCENHGLEIQNELYVDDVIFNKNGFEGDILFVDIIKHILKLMLNSNIVSSNLAWLLRSNLTNEQNFNSRLTSSIYLLDSLGIECEIARYNLYYYVCEDVADAGDTIGDLLLKAFPTNDVLFFLFENYEDSISDKINTLNSIINPTVDDTDESPKKKRKKVEKPFHINFKNIIHYYLFYGYNNGEFICYYEGKQYRKFTLAQSREAGLKYRKCSIEPLKSTPWYRREINHGRVGIYNSFSQTFERNMPSLFTGVYITLPGVFAQYPNEVFDPLNYQIKSFLYSTYMKIPEFLKILNNNVNAVILLGRPKDVGKDLEYITEKVNILDVDLNYNLNLDIDLFKALSEDSKFSLLNKYFKDLAIIICSISKKFNIELNNRAKFILFFNGDGTDIVKVEEKVSFDIQTVCDYISEASNKDVSLFINKLFKTTEGLRQNLNVDVKLKKLSDVIFYPNSLEELDGMSKYLILNYFNSKIIGDYKWQDNDLKFNEFVFIILSWFIRSSVKEEFESSNFFVEISTNRKMLFKQINELYRLFFGQLIINTGFTSMAKYFQRFCESTTLDLNNFHFNTKYNLNEKYCKHSKDIYLGFMDLLFQAHFNLDTFIDLTKIITSYTHRGTVLRKFLALLGKSQTGKNQFIGKMNERIFCGGFEGGLNQNYNNSDLQNCYNANIGYPFAVNMWSNLIVWFDEVETLPTAIKTFVNNTSLIHRELFANIRSNFNINSSIIISANDTPVGEDIAANLRMLPIQRYLQYTDLIPDIYISREDCVDNPVLDPINQIFGIQLLVKRLPSNDKGYQWDIGTHMIIWNMASLFYNTFDAPVSKIFSKTMSDTIRDSLHFSSSLVFLLDNGYFNFTPTSSVTEEQFKNKVYEILSKNSRKEKYSVTLKNLYAHIGAYRDIHKKLVYVEFLK